MSQKIFLVTEEMMEKRKGMIPNMPFLSQQSNRYNQLHLYKDQKQKSNQEKVPNSALLSFQEENTLRPKVASSFRGEDRSLLSDGYSSSLYRAKFLLVDENHTMGNHLRCQLNRHPVVTFAAYCMPVPLCSNVLLGLWVRPSSKKTPSQVLIEVLDDLIQEMDILQESLQGSIQESLKESRKESRRDSLETKTKTLR